MYYATVQAPSSEIFFKFFSFKKNLKVVQLPVHTKMAFVIMTTVFYMVLGIWGGKIVLGFL